MEKRIKQYEKFIAAATSELQNAKNPKSQSFRDDVHELAAFHNEMLTHFQHERLIHLIVTFFFAGIMLLCVVANIILPNFINETLILIPFSILTLILFVLTLFYIKHYYFLENHIQALYKYNRILHELL